MDRTRKAFTARRSTAREAAAVWFTSPGPLLYGEWLRARTDASTRVSNSEPHETFNDSPEGFAEPARHELVVTERRCEATDDERGVLTPQEAQIARLARDGLSNPEIGAQLSQPSHCPVPPPQGLLKLEILGKQLSGFRRSASSHAVFGFVH